MDPKEMQRLKVREGASTANNKVICPANVPRNPTHSNLLTSVDRQERKLTKRNTTQIEGGRTSLPPTSVDRQERKLTKEILPRLKGEGQAFHPGNRSRILG